MSKILEINNLTFSYPEKPLFHGLSLEIEEGKYITIIGNNKSGKTTLMKLICGILNSKDSIVAGYGFSESVFSEIRFRKMDRLLGRSGFPWKHIGKWCVALPVRPVS